MTTKVKVTCNECGKKWRISASRETAPQCSRCNSVDVEIGEEV